jgi:hypothetical protein
MRCYSRTLMYLLMLYGALSAYHCFQSPFPDGQPTNREGRPKWCSFFIRTSLFGLHRAAQIRDLDGVDGTIGIFLGTPPRDRQRPRHTLGPPDWGSVERWAGGETLQLSIKRILPAHAISPTALAPTALEYSLFLCPGCRTDRVRKPRAAPHMYSPLAAGSGMSRHPASRSASRTWQASRWLPIWLRCTPSST